ncbi:MAG: M20 peptidase family dipeptidase, partial [Pseudomonadota bacterium]
MGGTRAGALARADAHFDGGDFFGDLARRIAIPTESQEPDRGPDLARYVREEIAPWLAPLGYEANITDNPDPRCGPFLVATRHEGEGLKTLLTYGHGDVVRGIPEQWRDGLTPFSLTVEG